MFATIPDLRLYDHSHGDFHIIRGGTSTFPDPGWLPIHHQCPNDMGLE